MKRESVGWILVATTFLGVVLGLSLTRPVQRECAPLQQPGYGRSPTNFRLRTSDGLL
jgi:hypothetical protein